MQPKQTIEATAAEPIKINITVGDGDGRKWIINGREVNMAEYWQALGADPSEPLSFEMPAIITYTPADK